jgi:hypothetical protein
MIFTLKFDSSLIDEYIKELERSGAISSCSPSMRMSSSSRSSAAMAAVTSLYTWAAASFSSGESSLR